MLLFSSFALAPELLCCWSFQWFYYKNPPHQKRVFKWLHQCGVSASLHRSNSAADALSSANAPASQANKLVLPPLEFSSCEPLNFKQCKHVMFHNWKFPRLKNPSTLYPETSVLESDIQGCDLFSTSENDKRKKIPYTTIVMFWI